MAKRKRKVVRKRKRRRSGVLLQATPVARNARNAQIMATALRKAKGRKGEISNLVRGLSCPSCDSRNTKTEFYRLGSMKRPNFGVTACDDCGAC